MSNHGDITRGVNYGDACKECGGTRTEGRCAICARECFVPPDEEELLKDIPIEMLELRRNEIEKAARAEKDRIDAEISRRRESGMICSITFRGLDGSTNIIQIKRSATGAVVDIDAYHPPGRRQAARIFLKDPDAVRKMGEVFIHISEDMRAEEET